MWGMWGCGGVAKSSKETRAVTLLSTDGRKELQLKEQWQLQLQDVPRSWGRKDSGEAVEDLDEAAAAAELGLPSQGKGKL